MKEEEKDRLRSLFQQIELEEPALGFESRLMQQVKQVAEEQSRKRSLKNKIMNVLFVALGVCAMIGLPILVLNIMGWTPDERADMPDLISTLAGIEFNPLWILLSLTILMLLMLDTLIRKRITRNKHSE